MYNLQYWNMAAFYYSSISRIIQHLNLGRKSFIESIYFACPCLLYHLLSLVTCIGIILCLGLKIIKDLWQVHKKFHVTHYTEKYKQVVQTQLLDLINQGNSQSCICYFYSKLVLFSKRHIFGLLLTIHKNKISFFIFMKKQQ